MALRSGIGITEETDKEKDKQKTITRKVRGVDVTTKVPDDEVGGFTVIATELVFPNTNPQGATGQALCSGAVCGVCRSMSMCMSFVVA